MLVAFLNYEIRIIYITFKIFQMIVLNIINLLIRNYGIEAFFFWDIQLIGYSLSELEFFLFFLIY